MECCDSGCQNEVLVNLLLVLHMFRFWEKKCIHAQHKVRQTFPHTLQTAGTGESLFELLLPILPVILQNQTNSQHLWQIQLIMFIIFGSIFISLLTSMFAPPPLFSLRQNRLVSVRRSVTSIKCYSIYVVTTQKGEWSLNTTFLIL